MSTSALASHSRTAPRSVAERRRIVLQAKQPLEALDDVSVRGRPTVMPRAATLVFFLQGLSLLFEPVLFEGRQKRTHLVRPGFC